MKLLNIVHPRKTNIIVWREEIFEVCRESFVESSIRDSGVEPTNILVETASKVKKNLASTHKQVVIGPKMSL